MAARRAAARKRGDCSICCCRRPRPGRSCCDYCADRLAKAGRRRLRAHKAAGTCSRCPEPRTHGGLCERHYEAHQKHSKKRPLRDKKIRAGICITSTCEGTAIDHQKCLRCRREDTDKALDRQNARVAAGFCRCGKRRVKVPGESCEPCKKKRRRRRGHSASDRALDVIASSLDNAHS